MWFFEIAWPFGYGAFALYLIGMAQTLADSHKAISTGWLPSPRVVDIVGTSIFLGPFLINEPMCLIIGYLITTNMKVAEILVRIHYFIWSLHCCTLAFTVLYSGTRLCRILTAHLEKFNAGGPRFDAIRTGIIKIRFVMFLISTCLILFAAMGFIYAALRTEMMRSTVGNMAFGGSFMLLGPITTFFVELTVAFNPRSTNIIKVETKSLSSNEEFGSNMYNSAYTSTCVNNDIGTLSRNAFADLKQQQVFYQKQYQGQLQGQENKNSDITTGIKSSTVTTILSGDIELSRTASSSLNGESRNNNIDNINVIPLMAIAQKHKEGNLTIYHQSQQHQQLQLQQSGGSSAKDSIIEEDIVHQEYSSKLSLILNDRH
ncbi:hypothetical protein BDC45DRAFT_60719 [Circinella umbellata]|nr:hypothetical protein BDC45DRAFT_60719 [Circinella umbellata]